MAVQYGHAGVVRELLRENGIRGCAGVTGGVPALRGAAKEQHVGVMAMLADAGVADAGGQALVIMAEFGREASVKFLIGLQEKRRETARVSYVSDTLDPCGRTPVLSGIGVSPERSCSPRIIRMLIDAGAANLGRREDYQHARRGGVQRHAAEHHGADTARAEDLRAGRHRGEATQAGGRPPPAAAAGCRRSCCLLAVAERL
ncbi:unnamed protein product [Ectocarpus sp. CCAP 1310/34]|nr:unnamed protein product [Ectocarpus sp. CCAP 1310/34]